MRMGFRFLNNAVKGPFPIFRRPGSVWRDEYRIRTDVAESSRSIPAGLVFPPTQKKQTVDRAFLFQAVICRSAARFFAEYLPPQFAHGLVVRRQFFVVFGNGGIAQFGVVLAGAVMAVGAAGASGQRGVD